MLRRAVLEAVREGKFHIWAVTTIDEGIEILTGVEAGVRDEDGNWTPDSINDRVQKRLESLGKTLMTWGKTASDGSPEVVAPSSGDAETPPPPKPPEGPQE